MSRNLLYPQKLRLPLKLSWAKRAEEVTRRKGGPTTGGQGGCGDPGRRAAAPWQSGYVESFGSTVRLPADRGRWLVGPARLGCAALTPDPWRRYPGTSQGIRHAIGRSRTYPI
jgi:hypothetical protein